MSYQNTLALIPQFSEDQGIYYMHTERGALYDHFLDGNYVAIGHNEVTPAMLNLAIAGDDTQARNVLAQFATEEYAQDQRVFFPESTTGKRRLSTDLNSQIRFHELKKNDIVIIPNQDSTHLSIGVVSDDKTYAEQPTDECNYIKRKKVSWAVRDRPLRALDPRFVTIRHGRQPIFNIKPALHEAVKKSVYPMYIDGDRRVLTIHIKKEEGINPYTLSKYINSVMKVLEKIKVQENLDEDLEKLSLKIVVESPGRGSWVQQGGKSLLILGAMLLTFNSCREGLTNNPNGMSVDEINEQAINETVPEIRQEWADMLKHYDELDSETSGMYKKFD